MRYGLLFTLFLVFANFWCGYEYGESHRPDELSDALRARLSQKKRDFLKIEELQVGDGPLAAWNRRITVDIQVRYTDGTEVYNGNGSAFFLSGFYGLPDAGIYNERHFSGGQEGIRMGINGMAVGGKRRITVSPDVVCRHVKKGDKFQIGCFLIGPGNFGQEATVRKETLVVEAKLTESCIPVKLKGFLLVFRYKLGIVLSGL